jgi:heat-inducible transcriptional repressor
MRTPLLTSTALEIGGLAGLDQRARDIFRRIVETYLETGEPVGRGPCR